MSYWDQQLVLVELVLSYLNFIPRVLRFLERHRQTLVQDRSLPVLQSVDATVHEFAGLRMIQKLLIFFSRDLMLCHYVLRFHLWIVNWWSGSIMLKFFNRWLKKLLFVYLHQRRELRIRSQICLWCSRLLLEPPLALRTPGECSLWLALLYEMVDLYVLWPRMILLCMNSVLIQSFWIPKVLVARRKLIGIKRL